MITVEITKKDIDAACKAVESEQNVCTCCIVYQVLKRLQYNVIGVGYEKVSLADGYKATLDDRGQNITHLYKDQWSYDLVGTKFSFTISK